MSTGIWASDGDCDARPTATSMQIFTWKISPTTTTRQDVHSVARARGGGGARGLQNGEFLRHHPRPLQYFSSLPPVSSESVPKIHCVRTPVYTLWRYAIKTVLSSVRTKTRQKKRRINKILTWSRRRSDGILQAPVTIGSVREGHLLRGSGARGCDGVRVVLGRKVGHRLTGRICGRRAPTVRTAHARVRHRSVLVLGPGGRQLNKTYALSDLQSCYAHSKFH